MATYHGVMAPEAVGIQLVDEAVDVTASELHVRVLFRLRAALAYALRGKAGVLSEIFLRVDNREQASPDVLVAPGITPGTRSVYDVPPEPVPSVTVEVLSPANAISRGRSELETKRSLFARIGVALHIEINPDDGFIAVWELGDGVLARTELCTTYTSDAIGGVRLETPAPGLVHVFLPDGREVLDDHEELARGDRESARAERLAGKLRELGIDPES